MEKQKNKKGKYVLFGLGILAISGTAYYFIKKRGSSQSKLSEEDFLSDSGATQFQDLIPSTTSSSSKSEFPLKKGSKGAPVKQLQDALNKKNAKPKLKVDGMFGSLTEDATKIFQKKNKLKADGKVGEKTGFTLGIGKRPKSVEWPHGAMDAQYLKLVESRKFNSNVVKDAIHFLKAAQDDVHNVKRALTIKETTLANTEKTLVKLFAEHKRNYDEMQRMRIACEKLTSPAEIAVIHKKAAGRLQALKTGSDAWYDSMQVIAKVKVEIKAYSEGLKKIKRG